MCKISRPQRWSLIRTPRVERYLRKLFPADSSGKHTLFKFGPQYHISRRRIIRKAELGQLASCLGDGHADGTGACFAQRFVLLISKGECIYSTGNKRKFAVGRERYLSLFL